VELEIMSFENETFRKAATNAGVKGKDWKGNDAIEDFSEYYHNNWDKWERETDGYEGIKKKAESWWSNNKHKYS
jgi:hypothetical protein